MNPGSLIKVKPGYYDRDYASPYGVILEEELNIRALASGDMFRTFHVVLPGGVYRMMAYEFDVITSENTNGTS
jgi:hypothetical protein